MICPRTVCYDDKLHARRNRPHVTATVRGGPIEVTPNRGSRVTESAVADSDRSWDSENKTEPGPSLVR